MIKTINPVLDENDNIVDTVAGVQAVSVAAAIVPAPDESKIARQKLILQKYFLARRNLMTKRRMRRLRLRKLIISGENSQKKKEDDAKRKAELEERVYQAKQNKIAVGGTSASTPTATDASVAVGGTSATSASVTAASAATTTDAAAAAFAVTDAAAAILSVGAGGAVVSATKAATSVGGGSVSDKKKQEKKLDHRSGYLYIVVRNSSHSSYAKYGLHRGDLSLLNQRYRLTMHPVLRRVAKINYVEYTAFFEKVLKFVLINLELHETVKDEEMLVNELDGTYGVPLIRQRFEGETEEEKWNCDNDNKM